MKSLAEAFTSTRESIAQVEDHADADWLAYAWEFLLDYIATHEEVFCDDLWAAGLVEPREPRALGALMARARRLRLIEKSGVYRPSMGLRSNVSNKPIWRVL